MDERQPAPPERRPPTASEARALGHPLRLRILFACRDRARTNKELARALETTPGTIHYHLKLLVEQGFLRPEDPRPGPRGSTEQPYRSTGKSWALSGDPAGGRVLREVGVSEVLEAADDDIVTLLRLGLSLSRADVAELTGRLEDLAQEFADRSATTPDGPPPPDGLELESLTLFVSAHRNPDGPEASSPER